jgi:ABC-type molybdate transport system substrate-binding protein
MDEFQKLGRIVAESRGFVGRSRMGVVVHAQAPVPPLGDTAAFKRSLAGASAVVHNKASSGIYAAKLLEKLGLKEALGSKIVVVETGSAIMEYVDKGCAVKLAAPLPDEIQNVTSYDAAATRSSQAAEAARRLAASFTSDAAKRIFSTTGIS